MLAGYGVAVMVLDDGKKAIIGFLWGAPAYLAIAGLSGWVFKVTGRSTPWQRGVWVTTLLSFATDGGLMLFSFLTRGSV
jgi:hypothetical protein